MSLHAIDTAIGMVFVYLLLTLIASVVVEQISTARGWRGQMLRDAIDELLARDGITADQIYTSPYVRCLLHEPTRCEQTAKRLPSYIPAQAFSSSLLAGLWEQCRTLYGDLPTAKPDATVEALSRYADSRLAGNSSLRSLILTTTALQGPSVQAVRLAIERWFNDAMDRVTGWYKRRVRSALFILGVIGALVGNVDSMAIARWLWTNDDARQSLVSAAIDYAKNRPSAAETPAPGQPPLDPNSDAAFAQRMQQFATDVNTATSKLMAYRLPVGWDGSATPAAFSSFMAFMEYLIGCLVTGIAISVGSTFWFDALQTLIRIRATGPRPSS
jgi:hypothetical protein